MPGVSSRKPIRDDKILIVEGTKDRLVIPEFIELSGISWPRNKPPVDIRETGGIEEISSTINNILKSEPWTNVGVMVDADQNASNNWNKIRQECNNHFPGIPVQIPTSGHWHGTSGGKKLGIWIMPGGNDPGMLEDFLVGCMAHSQTNDSLWLFAQTATLDAQKHNHTYKDRHKTKAQVHCWLAWQDEPGNQLHIAVKQQRFIPAHGRGPEFVQWFRDVFNP